MARAQKPGNLDLPGSGVPEGVPQRLSGNQAVCWHHPLLQQTETH